MLHAHVRGKLLAVLRRVVPTVETIALDAALRESEDVLTAAFFSRMLYIPPEIAWDIVVGSATPLIGERPERPEGTRIRQKLWERYFPDASNPASYVEPDVVWLLGGLAVVVEAKWRDGYTADQLHRGSNRRAG